MKNIIIPAVCCVFLSVIIIAGLWQLEKQAHNQLNQHIIIATQDGRDGFRAGLAPSDNPYNSWVYNDKLRRAWLKGWLEAKENHE